MKNDLLTVWQPLLEPWFPVPYLIVNRKGELKGGTPLAIDSLHWPLVGWPQCLHEVVDATLAQWFVELTEREWEAVGRIHYAEGNQFLAVELDSDHISLFFLQDQWRILSHDGPFGEGLDIEQNPHPTVLPDQKIIWSPAEQIYISLLPTHQVELAPAFLSPQWRTILELTPAASVIADVSGYILHVNTSFERITGFPVKNVIGKKIDWNYTQASDLMQVQEAWEQVKSGAPWQGDLEAFRLDGSIYPEKITIWPIPEENGEIRHIMMFKEDLSEVVSWKKELEIRDKKLQEVAEIIPKARLNEARYRSIIQASQTGAWEYNLETGTLWISEEYYAMLGLRPDNALGESFVGYEKWLSLVHPEDRFEAAKVFKTYLDGDRSEIYVNFFRMMHVSGEPVWVLSRGHEVKTIDGNPTSLVLGVHINITDLKKAEQIIKDRDLYHQALLELIPDMLLVVDKEGVCLDFKPGQVELLAPPEVFLGKPLADVISPEIATLHKRSAAEALSKQKMVSITYSAKLGEQERHFRSTIVAFGQEKTLSSITDITEDINRIRQLERLLAIEEKQNQQLHEFAHIVSHHFRSQVSGVLGILHLMSLEDPERYRNLDIQFIQKASDQLNTTIGHLAQILDMRRSTEGKWRTFNLVPLLQEVAAAELDKCYEIQGELTCICDGESWYLHSVPEYIQGIIQELIRNAKRFRDEKRKLKITIQLVVEPEWYQIHVQDNGLGMDERTLGHIFSMYKSYNHGAESFQGLGLFIAHHQAEVLGGTLTVSSVIGAGTTFVLSLPRVS